MQPLTASTMQAAPQPVQLPTTDPVQPSPATRSPSVTSSPPISPKPILSSDSEQTSKSLSPGAVAGISVGVIAAVLIVAAAAFYRFRLMRRPQANVPISEMVNIEVNPGLRDA